MTQRWRRAITRLTETPGQRDPEQEFFLAVFTQAISDLAQEPLNKKFRTAAEINEEIEKERLASDRFLFGEGLYGRYRRILLTEGGLKERVMWDIADRAVTEAGIPKPPCMAAALNQGET